MVFINFNTTIDDHTKFQKSPGITRPIGEPVLLPGEDYVSFERHTKILQVLNYQYPFD